MIYGAVRLCDISFTFYQGRWLFWLGSIRIIKHTTTLPTMNFTMLKHLSVAAQFCLVADVSLLESHIIFTSLFKYVKVFAIKYTYNLLNYRLKSVKHKLEVKGWILLQWVSIITGINQWRKQNYTIKIIKLIEKL